MSGPAATWLAWRLIARSHFVAGRIDRALRELALALHDPSLERLSVVQHYDGSPSYLNNQHAGFFPFERRALDQYFPRPNPSFRCGPLRES